MVAGLALLSALAYGASDFFAGLAARRASVLRATVVTYAAGTLGLAALTLAYPHRAAASALAAGSLAGVFAVVGLLTFYAALVAGPMGVLSPAIATMGAAVPVAVGVMYGETLGPVGWTGILAALVAAGLLGSPSEGPARSPDAPVDDAKLTTPAHRAGWTRRTVVLTLVSGVTLGLSVVALDAAPSGTGLMPGLVELGVGLVILLVVEALVRISARIGRAVSTLDGPDPAGGVARPAWPGKQAIGAGALLAVGQALLVIALDRGDLAVVAALLATYPLATVMLARLVLGERFGGRTRVGIGVALLAAILLGAS
jgi:drug/metabolite transporter (DMT)-like permease